jgi:thiol-disulfide isomerase/thioredoxin
MHFYKTITLFTIVFALILAACAPAGGVGNLVTDTGSQDLEKDDAMLDKDDYAMMDKDEDAMMDKDDDAMMDKDEDAMMDKDDDAMMDKGDDAMMDKDDNAMMAYPEWFTVSLTDVSSMMSFTIKDLKGKVVLVEPFAIWCPNCLQQQNQVKMLHEKLGERDDFVSIGLNVDPNENAEDVKAYISQRGFDWKYVNAPGEVQRNISDLYGTLYLNPSSTPIFHRPAGCRTPAAVRGKIFRGFVRGSSAFSGRWNVNSRGWRAVLEYRMPERTAFPFLLIWNHRL